MLIDTHTHLDADAFVEDQEQVIQRALDQGVERMINVGFDRKTITSTLELAEKYDFIYAVIGWHPVDAVDMTEEDLKWIEQLATTHPKVVGIGETGLDYHWDKSPRAIQQDVFRKQIDLAKRIGKPIIIHNRDAHQDVVDILREENASEVGGIMHCYSGSWEIAKQCLDMNFYISFGGPVTFKNAKQPKEVLKKVPLDRLLVETDSPYLTPHPYRGKRNESGYVKLVAEAAAELTGKTFDEIIRITGNNAKKVFDIF
ncbi:TatD family hydrolase [Marinicrinis sediminis]|uniref:TatD family hydrolase n=1 Tax=Marinicrinis sediminis TaxID=1652465 RepID=A0ABW5R9X5_9BACL